MLIATFAKKVFEYERQQGGQGRDSTNPGGSISDSNTTWVSIGWDDGGASRRRAASLGSPENGRDSPGSKVSVELLEGEEHALPLCKEPYFVASNPGSNNTCH
jgi:hypothetical protein